MNAAPIGVRVPRDVVRASGPDARTFLQGQCTQDVASLAVGASAWAMVLEPSGRLVSFLRVTRTGEDDLLLDLDAGCAEQLVTRLQRFKLRTLCDLTPEEGWSLLAVRGPGADGVATPPGMLRVAASWPSGDAVDLLGVDPVLPAGVLEGSSDDLARLRIREGVPAMGAELGEDTIPAEGGAWLMGVAVSFTKGCYTGQELVARVDARGSNTPHRLRRLRSVEGGFRAEHVGAALFVGDRAVGRVGTTVDGEPVALAVVHRSVEVGDLVRVDGGAAAGCTAVAEDAEPVRAAG